MDANAVGHVHELDLDDIKLILERARSFKPGREINILFSGGEPTISSFFLDAIRSARKMGFKRLHVATNGIRFAQDADFAQQAREAGQCVLAVRWSVRRKQQPPGSLKSVPGEATGDVANSGRGKALT
jgi:uncharacterized radical SAM superfamily Fe-S cluster-containing enzyme